MQGQGKFGSETSKYALRNIAGKASDIHEEVNLIDAKDLRVIDIKGSEANIVER